MPIPMPRGSIVWYDCMTTDTGKAIAFYTKLFGWTTMPVEGNSDYTMFANGGVPLGGVMTLPEDARKMGAPSNWLMYVGTPSIEDTLKQASGLGANTLVPPTDVPGMGRFAVLADPQGATFALWTSAAPAAEVPAAPKVGEVAWNELATTGWEGAFSFYQKLFGWEKRAPIDMGPHGIYQLWSRPGYAHDLGGFYDKTPEMPVNAWCYYVRVADLDASLAKATSLGANVMLGPMDVPSGDRIAACMDPTGAVFAMVWLLKG